MSKQYEWIKERAKIIKRAVEEGRITINEQGNIYGICTDCSKYRPLSPDHKRKRSQGGEHIYSNIDWVCNECHDLRDNKGDPMGKKEKSNIYAWKKSHKCISCKQPTRQFICHLCNKVSIKIPTKR